MPLLAGKGLDFSHRAGTACGFASTKRDPASSAVCRLGVGRDFRKQWHTCDHFATSSKRRFERFGGGQLLVDRLDQFRVDLPRVLARRGDQRQIGQLAHPAGYAVGELLQS